MIYYRPVFSNQTHAEGLNRSPKGTHHTGVSPCLHSENNSNCYRTLKPSNDCPHLHFVTFFSETTTPGTSHHTESDHAQLHFHQQYKPDRSNLTSASYSTGYLSICFWFIFLQSKEEIMIDNQQLGSTADLLGKIEDSLKNIASHLLFPNKALEASSESQMHHAFVRMDEGPPIADSSPQMMFTSKC